MNNGYNPTTGINPAMLGNGYPNSGQAPAQGGGRFSSSFNPALMQAGQQQQQPGQQYMGGMANPNMAQQQYQHQLLSQQNGQMSTGAPSFDNQPGQAGMGSMGSGYGGQQPIQPQHSGNGNPGMGALGGLQGSNMGNMNMANMGMANMSMGMKPSMGMGMNQGMANAGMNPGMQPGMNPGMQPGMNPSMQPGMNPSMQSGMNPGMQPASGGFQLSQPQFEALAQISGRPVQTLMTYDSVTLQGLWQQALVMRKQRQMQQQRENMMASMQGGMNGGMGMNPMGNNPMVSNPMGMNPNMRMSNPMAGQNGMNGMGTPSMSNMNMSNMGMDMTSGGMPQSSPSIPQGPAATMQDPMGRPASSASGYHGGAASSPPPSAGGGMGPPPTMNGMSHGSMGYGSGMQPPHGSRPSTAQGHPGMQHAMGSGMHRPNTSMSMSGPASSPPPSAVPHAPTMGGPGRMPTPAQDIPRPPTASGMNGPGANMHMGAGPSPAGMPHNMAGMQRPPSRVASGMDRTPSIANVGLPGQPNGMAMRHPSINTGMNMSSSMGMGIGMGMSNAGMSIQHPSLARHSTGMGMGAPSPGGMGMADIKDEITTPVSGVDTNPLMGAMPGVQPMSAGIARQGSMPGFGPPGEQAIVGPPGGLPPAGIPPLSREQSHMPPAPVDGPRLHARRTRIEPGVAPPLDDDEVAQVRKWMDADDEYVARRRARNGALLAEAAHPETDLRTGLGLRGALGPAWWERDPGAPPPPGQRRKFGIELPKDAKARERERRKDPKRREGIRVPSKIPKADAERPEVLVPIRLEFDVEHQKMRDTFTWNLNDAVITPEMFAQTVVEDYGLPPAHHATITKLIQDQLSDFKAHAAAGAADADDEGSAPRRGTLSDADVRWWKAWRRGAADRARAAKGEAPRKRRKVAVEDEPLGLDGFEFDEGAAEDEMRIVVKVDVIVGSMKLEDQIEWDVANKEASPEQFAEVYARDLGLTGEFKTAVVHQIREQITAHQKTIFLSGGVAGLMADEELRTSVLPSLASGARSLEQVGAFTPLLNYVSDSEIERGEREREKEIVRRRKRGNRARRGVAMPEREPQRTFRTPGIGFAPVDPANLTAQAILNAPTSRRAAAAAAQINIANMVASENRPEDMDPSSSPITAATMSLPQTSAPTAKAPKEPQPKGLFKAPEYPPSVLRPRAAAKAPTPSNAFERGYLLPDAVLDHAPPPAMSSRPPDSRADRERPDSVRRAREAERDAKEQEFKESQHPNYIDGVWHCTNCGCPDNLAVGRRKGPMGEKTQCGICGKYWHRHRKPRPIEYHAEAEYHQGLKDDAARQKAAAARKKSGRPPLAALMEKEESMGSDAKGETPRRVSSRSITRVQSPVTSDDSGDEAPLAAQQGRTNGSRPSPSEGVSTPDVSQGLPAPAWLRRRLSELQGRYPRDSIDITLKNSKDPVGTAPEWRLKCLDCPGKLYNHGPGESLDNFEVHVKNRNHRSRVDYRLEHGVRAP